jgi:hypothetical protein
MLLSCFSVGLEHSEKLDNDVRLEFTLISFYF